MAKFRKKPIVIEAFQWTGGPDQMEDPEWINSAIKEGVVWFIDTCTPRVKLAIRAPDGLWIARPGDWIIKGIKGELYPCKPDIFEVTYEAVKSEVSKPEGISVNVSMNDEMFCLGDGDKLTFNIDRVRAELQLHIVGISEVRLG